MGLSCGFEHITTPVNKKSHCLIAISEQMKKILSSVDLISKSNASVFIYGESGTGKEMIAHAIHKRSNRHLNPFIQVNCAAIASTLLESEFFGHEKGAFTGAIQRKLGRFERAHTGTLLLDEISEISLELQPKLLRVIQEREFERVGGTHPIQVDVRLISTSNRSMKEMIEKNLFREDLYYRLNVIPVYLPALRERKDDILPLSEYFLKKFCQENATSEKRFSESAKQRLLQYSWPGNIRELSNVIERCTVLSHQDTIFDLDLNLNESPLVNNDSIETLPIGATLAEMEKRMILATLKKENDNRTRAAQVLGISLRTLRNKLHAYAQKNTSF